MDPKKAELNPELKQIYERVMNTQVKRPDMPGGTAAPEPQVSQPTAAVQQPQPAPVAASPQIGTTQIPQTSAPRPVTGGGPFVFKGGKTGNAKTGVGAAKTQGAKSALSGKIILILVGLLLVVWGVFWAKIFGLF